MPLRAVDITGKTFGRLTVVRRSGTDKWRKSIWFCVCVCGGTKEVVRTNLLNGGTSSCGCLNRERTSQTHTTHGHSYKTSRGCTPEYNSWRAAKERCFNTKFKNYHNYGGRGITMCVLWRSDFTAFLKYMGARPEGMTLDRFPDNNGNYEPGNCRWATWKQQRNNQRKATACIQSTQMVPLEESITVTDQLPADL